MSVDGEVEMIKQARYKRVMKLQMDIYEVYHQIELLDAPIFTQDHIDSTLQATRVFDILQVLGDMSIITLHEQGSNVPNIYKILDWEPLDEK